MQRQLSDRQAVASLLEGLAGAAILEQPPQPLRAAQLLGAAETLRESIAAPIVHHAAHGDYDRYLTAVRAALSEEAFAAAWARGRAMELAEMFQYALEVVR